MIVTSLVLGFYFSSLLAFSFVTHPIVYCYLLVLSAASVVCYVYLVIGFSWYVVLFCLVYIGGVYVLFIFVSMHNPNPLSGFSGGYGFVALAWLLFSFLFIGYFTKYGGSFSECSHYLCSYFEGVSYVYFCLVLMLGFVVISAVCGDKDSFFR